MLDTALAHSTKQTVDILKHRFVQTSLSPLLLGLELTYVFIFSQFFDHFPPPKRW